MKKSLLLAALLLSTAAYSFEVKQPSEYSVKGVYNFGKINGYVQIPKGGQSGTTSKGRPTFNELGIHHISYPEVELKAKWEKLAVYGDINYQTFKGSSEIKENLVTHSRNIPVGAHMSTKHKYISYTLGASYDAYQKDSFAITPLMEVSAYNFKYSYSANTLSNESISGKRDFNWIQGNYGVKLAYQLTDNFAMKLTMKSGIPLNNVKKYYNVDLMNSYTVYSNGSNKLNLLFGLGYEKLEFKDKQRDAQNHMEHKISPIYKAGLEFVF